MNHFKRLSVFLLVAFLTLLSPLNSFAEGGISIEGTRIVYPMDSTQQSIGIDNSSATDTFLVQAWVEDATGKKTEGFILTPPLYLSGPKSENILRLMLMDNNLPRDRESLYYFIAKEIPSINTSQQGNRNVVKVAVASRIKLFVRPAGLETKREDAPGLLTFHHAGQSVELSNPTPYYITLTSITIGGSPQHGVMISPKSHLMINTSALVSANYIFYKTINDFGVVSQMYRGSILD